METGTKAAQDRPVPNAVGAALTGAPPPPSNGAAGGQRASTPGRGGFFAKLGQWIGLSHPREESGPSVYFAGFGKHPGWDDHVLDLGIETDALAGVQRSFYVRGIGENIDKGEWDRLEPEQRLPEFRHVFLWRKGRDVFAGRMWASRDSKDRAKYPMVLCAQYSSVPVDRVASLVPAHLEQAMQRCQETTSADDVRQIVASTQAALRGTLQNPAAGVTTGVTTGVAVGPFDYLADRPELGPNRRGLLAILYEVEREMAAYRPAPPNAPTQLGSPVVRPHQLRVPTCGLAPFDAARTWVEFLAALLSPSTSLLAIQPIGQPWLDVIVGEPTPDDLFCMMATPKRVPLTSDIPHKMDEEFVRRANRQIEQNRRPAPDAPGAPGAAGTPNLPDSPVPA
jgi:hypothetical protein